MHASTRLRHASKVATVCSLVALLPATSAADRAAPGAGVDHLAPLRFLAGACWRGELPDSEQTDTHCYRSMLGMAFLRDTHRVGGGADGKEYSGETIYAWQPESGRIGYRYYNSLGGVSDGDVLVADGGRTLEFPDERYVGPDGRQIELRSTLKRLDADRYLMLTEQQDEDGWQPVRRIEFSRVANATEQGPAARQQADRLAALERLVGNWADPAEVEQARESGASAKVQFAYRWGPRRMLLRIYENPGSGDTNAFDPVLEGIVYWDHVTQAYSFAASTRYGWTFNGTYRVLDGGEIERVYDVHYAAGEAYIPAPELGGQVRRFRETLAFDGDDRLNIRLELLDDGEWVPFGPGSFAAVRAGP